MEANRIIIGDVLESLRTLPESSVNCVVTSPPYWGLRDYGVNGQIGLESTFDEYLERLQLVFSEVWRVLSKDGTLWLNMGDSYAGSRRGGDGDGALQGSRCNQRESNIALRAMTVSRRRDDAEIPRSDIRVPGLKPKDLIGQPWRLAFALQAAGWYLRQDIIWHKPNPMPESCKDRPTRAHEYLFLLSKAERYYYDFEAVKEPVKCAGDNTPEDWARVYNRRRESSPENRQDLIEVTGWKGNRKTFRGGTYCNNAAFNNSQPMQADSHGNNRIPFSQLTRNRRSVWTVATQPFAEAHFATFPEDLVEPCILAGCPEGGVVLDPFMGSGTVAVVAERLGRKWLGCELNPEYAAMAARRISAASRQQRLFAAGGE